jgi:DNA-binding CsgD family transcriptional regulator
VLNLVCKEYSTKRIGKELCISAKTAESDRKKLMEIAHVHNTVGLGIWAVKNKLV